MTDAPVEHRVRGSRGRDLRVLVWPASPVGGAAAPRGRVQLVHGYSEHVLRYDPVARVLADAGWAVFGHDQVGHGASDGARGVIERFDDYVDDLRTVAAHGTEWTGVDGPRVLLAHSLGALVAIRHLQEGGEAPDALVLSAPWLATRVPVPAVKRLAGKLLWHVAPDFTISNQIDPTLLSRDPEVQAARLRDPLAHARVSAGFYERSTAAQALALRGGLPGGFPVLMFLPEADRVADPAVARAWADGLGDRIERVSLPGVPHEPFNDTARNEIFMKLVEWMSTLRNGPAGRPTGDAPAAGE